MSDSSLSDLDDTYDDVEMASDQDIDTGVDDGGCRDGDDWTTTDAGIRAAYPDDDSSLGGEDELITLPSGSGSNGKGKQASYNVDFHVISKQELVSEMAKEIDHVSSALSLSVSEIRHESNKASCTDPVLSQTNDAAALLRHMKWNKERVIDVSALMLDVST